MSKLTRNSCQFCLDGSKLVQKEDKELGNPLDKKSISFEELTKTSKIWTFLENGKRWKHSILSLKVMSRNFLEN